MSYVLEALRRAEAERHRGQVPGVHAVTMDPVGTAGGAPGARSGWARRGPVLAVAGLALAAAALAVALWWRSPAAPEPAPRGAPQPAAVPAPERRPPAVAPPAAAVPARPARPAVLPPPVTSGPTDPVPEAATGSTNGPPQAASRPPAAPSMAKDTVVRLSALPEALRQQIPAMTFGGSTDSPEASARMLIINGQVWREGDEVAPGLRLDRIALRSAQFSFRGQRFEVAY